VAWPTDRPNRPRDPTLTSRKHRDHNRAHWQALRLPCARCGCAIDYDGPQYLADGTQNPRYLVVGHIVDRAQARLLGWSLERQNDLSNTQPECRKCSNDSGAQLAVQTRQKTARNTAPIAAPEASRW